MILGIYGAGGLGREVLDLARVINGLSKEWEELVLINDFEEESTKNGAAVLPFEIFKKRYPADTAKIVIAVGEPRVRQELRERVIASNYQLQSLVHPTAYIGSETQVGEGTIIQFGSFVSCNVRVGENALVQSNACIGHDSTIGCNTVVSSNVAIAGNCIIDDRVYVGLNVPVKENTTIGSDSIIGMGAVVVRDIAENAIALGNPARQVKNNETGQVFK